MAPHGASLPRPGVFFKKNFFLTCTHCYLFIYIHDITQQRACCWKHVFSNAMVLDFKKIKTVIARLISKSTRKMKWLHSFSLIKGWIKLLWVREEGLVLEALAGRFQLEFGHTLVLGVAWGQNFLLCTWLWLYDLWFCTVVSERQFNILLERR